MNRIGTLGAALASVVSFVALSQTARSASMFDYNLIVTNKLDTSSEVEGRTFVKNLNLRGSSQFGFKALVGTSDVLSVANDITSPQSVQIKPFYGVFRHTKPLPSNVTIDLQQNATAVQTPVDITSLASEIATTSSALASLTANSSYSAPANGNLGFTLNYNSLGQAIVSLPASVLNQNQNFNLAIPSLPSGRTLIINVTGLTSIDIQSNFNAQAIDAARVIWNFPSVTNINFGRSFYGSVIAPLASIKNSTQLTGGVYVANFTMDGEIHHPFNNTLPPTNTALPVLTGTAIVPEPAALGLMLVPLMGLVRRRR